jgi:hypothetical protein
MGVENPVEAALRADMKALVGQDGHDLPRWLGGAFRLVAGEHAPLALHVRETVRNKAVAAITAIQAVPITCELPPPALQGGQTDTQQPGEPAGPCTGYHSGIEDLQRFAPIRGKGQSPSSSPQ